VRVYTDYVFLFFIASAAKEREKASAQKGTPVAKVPGKKATGTPTKTPGASKKAPATSQKDLDMAGMNLGEKEHEQEAEVEAPKITMAREKLLEEVASTLASQQKDSPAISLVVIGIHRSTSSLSISDRLCRTCGCW
jgi:elongation factor 1 alpha-like protein